MSKSYEKFQKRRLIGSYFSVVLSIFLVLFLVSGWVFMLFKAKQIEQWFKEEIPMIVAIKEGIKPVKSDQLVKELQMSDFVKETEFITKDDAKKLMEEEYGKNYLDILGYNPLYSSINVFYKAENVTVPKLEELKDELMKNKIVDKVIYDQKLVTFMNKNIKLLTPLFFIASLILSVIAFLLINSAIRLAIYSKRLTIKTMQMVGATKTFIRRPFILNSIKLGLLGSLLTLLSVFAVLTVAGKHVKELAIKNNKTELLFITIGVLALGIFITWLSTFFATRKYLQLKTDDLY